MKSCLNCEHCHVTKDCEFWLEPEDQYTRNEVPKGRAFQNLDLFWCDKPEDSDDDFSVLSYGRPSDFQKDIWFPEIASICDEYEMEKVKS